MSIFGKKPDPEVSKSPATPTASPAPAEPKPRPAAPPQPTPQPEPRAAAPAPAPPREKSSFLGAGCSFEGEVAGKGSFECGGKIDGNVDFSGDVVIGHGGVAKAQLKGRRINVEGRLEGDASGSEKVEVGSSGHVEGDVRAPAVQFAEGAFFEGNVEMRRPKAQPDTSKD
jgi:cytoskeletal protein CcmA (bactofilin family)